MELGKRDMKEYHFAKLPSYDYFWCLVFLLGISVILMCVVCVRTFVFGYPSSHIYLSILFLDILFCMFSLWNHFSSSKKDPNEFILLLFYYVFAVVYALCLLSLPATFLGVDFSAIISSVNSKIASFFAHFSLPLHFHFSPSILAISFAAFFAILPPLLVEPSFRFAQLELRRGVSFSGFLASHLPLIIIVMSLPGILLRYLDGRFIHGVT